MRGMLYDYRRVTPDTVRAETDEGIARAESLVAGVEALADADVVPTLEATLLPLNDAQAAAAVAYGRGAFLARVHPDEAVRDAGQEAEERLNKWQVGLDFRPNLYRAIRAFADTPEAAALTGERRKYLERSLADFRRAGQELSDEQRAEVERLRNRLVELEVAFQRNIDDVNDGLELTRDDLEGLPETYIERLSPGERPGTYKVGIERSEWMPFLESSTRRDLRQRLQELVFTRAADTNRPLLEEALQIRSRVADILGYPSWAHYAVELKMAREPEAIERFYDELVPAVTEKARPEVERLREQLRADAPDDTTLRVWDWRYYDAQLRKNEYGVDAALISEYFPLQQVIDGMFELTAEVFDLSYVRVEDTGAWHPDVLRYEVHDGSTGDLLGHFYADLHPRDNKYSHAAAFPLVIGHRASTGEYVKPVSAIVANLPKPSADQPSLLRHDDVRTLFHEFGHILHMTVTRAEFCRFSGAETEWDFVEAPSQIMEHWTWLPDVLARFARHHKSGDPIPRELVEQLTAARDLDLGIETLRQASMGLLDLELHRAGDRKDLDEINRRTFEVSLLPFPENTFFPAGFGHIMGGYDAGYYGYLWAKVYGDDMFSRFEEAGPTDRTVGLEYRRRVLEPNGSKPAGELLRDFLGREPSKDAFLRHLGIGGTAVGV
jgi:Zn-dependent oligopeptidase